MKCIELGNAEEHGEGGEAVEERLKAEEGDTLALRNPVDLEGNSGTRESYSSSSSSTCALS